MNDEATLRQKARAAIQGGKLPRRLPDRTWAGKGGGGSCSVCTDPLDAAEIEFELEFTSADQQPFAVTSYHVHMRCLAAWEFERQNSASHECDVSDRTAPA